MITAEVVGHTTVRQTHVFKMGQPAIAIPRVAHARMGARIPTAIGQMQAVRSVVKSGMMHQAVTMMVFVKTENMKARVQIAARATRVIVQKHHPAPTMQPALQTDGIGLMQENAILTMDLATHHRPQIAAMDTSTVQKPIHVSPKEQVVARQTRATHVHMAVHLD